MTPVKSRLAALHTRITCSITSPATLRMAACVVYFNGLICVQRLLTCGSTYIVYQCCAFTQTIPKTRHTKTHGRTRHTPTLDRSRSQPPHTHIFLLTVARVIQIQLQQQLFAALPGSPRKPEPGCYRIPLDFPPRERRMQQERGEGERAREGEPEREGGGPMVWSWSRVGIFNNKH